MQFSIATLVSLLAAAEVATAWQIIGYTDTPSCDNRFTNRVLTGGGSSGCMTFGQSMPGVGCTHYGGQGAPAQACNGNLNIASIRVGTGENCVFYRNGGCSGDQIWYNRVNNCASFGSRTTIGSYKCSNA